MGVCGLGVLAGRENVQGMQTTSSSSAQKNKPGIHDQGRCGGATICGTGSGSKQNTPVIVSCETWRNTASGRSIDTLGVLVFVGMTLDFGGSACADSSQTGPRNSSNAEVGSVGQSTVVERTTGDAAAGCIGVGHSAVWVWTKVVKNAVDSWSARTVSTILGIRRGLAEGIDVWWRRVHRSGHAALNKVNLSRSKWSERLIHRWSGHLARLADEHWLAMVRRTQSVQWWRWRQCRHKDKWTGAHLKRL